ncbi:MAG: FctA domain-containing protein [Eubacteriales bacterium]|nr:FctA domain-containing protein [Eubacteriales bacterium]
MANILTSIVYAKQDISYETETEEQSASTEDSGETEDFGETETSDGTEESTAEEALTETEESEGVAKAAKMLYSAQGSVENFEQLQELLEENAVRVGSDSYEPLEIEINDDIEVTKPVLIVAGQTVTFTGNGKLVYTSELNNQSCIVIERNGTLIVDGVTVDGNSVETRAHEYTSGILVTCLGELQLKSGGFTNVNNSGSSAVLDFSEGASFIMTGGEISGHVYSESGRSQHAAVVRLMGDASFDMSGGTIAKNDLYDTANCAIVWLTPYFSEEKAVGNPTFTMDGGTISNNESYRHSASVGGDGSGGGLYICADGQATMNDGRITGNSATDCGGGVVAYESVISPVYTLLKENYGSVEDGLDAYVSSGYGSTREEVTLYLINYVHKQSFSSLDEVDQLAPAAFTMNGGEISNNSAVGASGGDSGASGDNGCGGGIYVASNHVTLKAGYITDNTAASQGGGIYVGSIPYVLHMHDAVITENTASVLGGGLWFCPTGDATNTVTSGGAIFGNHTSSDDSANSAGDDFVAVPQTGKTYTTTLADRMLGGGEVCWYQDGKVTGDDVLGNADGTSRYDADNPGDRITKIKNSTEGYALKAVVSDNAITLAKSMAKLWITGNTAKRGGGVGSNGGVVIGTEGEGYTLQVYKVWENDVREEEKVAITVTLKIGGYELDSVTLDQDNQWSATFEDLPNPDTLDGLEIAVVEDPVPEGFSPTYSEAKIDKDAQTIRIEISNTKSSDARVSLEAQKLLDGKEPTTQTFTFELRDASGQLIEAVTNQGGSVRFQELVFRKAGVYTYTISERAETNTGIVYDKSVYTAEITVTEQDGEYHVQTQIKKDGSLWASTPVFENRIKTEELEGTNAMEISDTEASPAAAVDQVNTGDESPVLALCIAMAVSFAGIAGILILGRRKSE